MCAYELKWMYGGFFILLLISSLSLLGEFNSPFMPMPFYLLASAWAISYFSIIVIPVFYVVELFLVQKASSPGVVVLSLVILVGVLNALDIWLSLTYDLQIKGMNYIRIVVAENVIAFLSLLLFSIYAFRKKTKVLIYSANLLLFILLAWCSFPYLGELP